MRTLRSRPVSGSPPLLQEGPSFAIRAAIYRSLRALRAQILKKVSTRVFWGAFLWIWARRARRLLHVNGDSDRNPSSHPQPPNPPRTSPNRKTLTSPPPPTNTDFSPRNSTSRGRPPKQAHRNRSQPPWRAPRSTRRRNTPENAENWPFRESAFSGVLRFRVCFGRPLRGEQKAPENATHPKTQIFGTVSSLRFRVCCIFGCSLFSSTPPPWTCLRGECWF